MSDAPAELTEPVREDVTAELAVEWEPIAGGKVRLTAIFDGDTLESGKYTREIFTEASVRGQFLSSVEDSLDSRGDADAAAARRALKEWFAGMAEVYRQEAEELVPDHIRRVLDGTRSVEIHGGDPTTVHVTLSYRGRTCDLEFTADEMTGNGDALVSRMANHFFVFDFECEQEEWEVIRERWQEQADVVAVIDETGEETVADRVLEYLAHNIVPIAEKEKLANSPGAAWVDDENAAGTSVADPDAPIVWVEKSFLIDQLEAAGKSPEYFSHLVKTLNRSDYLHGVPSDTRRYWPNSQGKERAGFYPFTPAALGVDLDNVGDVDDPAHGEVSP